MSLIGIKFVYVLIIIYILNVRYGFSNKTRFLIRNSRQVHACGKRMKPGSPKSLSHARRVRIVGGQEATAGSYPWQAMLYEEGGRKVFCGATLITNEWLITAAHCFHPSVTVDIDWNRVTVKLGKHNQDKTEIFEHESKISKKRDYPKFKVNTGEGDISLIQLARPAKLVPHIQPICLLDRQYSDWLFGLADANHRVLGENHGPVGVIAGWGNTNSVGGSSKILRDVAIPIVGSKFCDKVAGKPVTKNMFCAGYDYIGSDSCQGDSGGPFMIDDNDVWYLIGVISWGSECGGEDYGVYTKVCHYYEWIIDVLNN